MPLKQPKFCPSCSPNRRLPVDRFGNNSNNVDGMSTYCKDCSAEKQRAWKKANPAKVKAWKRRYIRDVKKRNGALAGKATVASSIMASIPE